MQQVNQNEQVGAGMLVFADKEGRLHYASSQGYDFSHQATKEECFHAATMLADGVTVTEESDAVELLSFAIYATELEEDEGKISHEQCKQGCIGFRWMIASLLDSPYWCAGFRQGANGKAVEWSYEKLTAEEFDKRIQDIQDRLEKLAA